MAIFVIKDDKTGQELEIEAPDDATEEEVLNYAHNAVDAQAANPQSLSEEAGEIADEAGGGAGQALNELKLGLQQHLTRLTGDKDEVRELNDRIKSSRKDYDDITSTAGKIGYWGTKVGLPVLAALLTRKPGLIASIGLGAASGAVEPTLPEDETLGVPSSIANPVLGGALGLLGKIGGDKLEKIFSGRAAKKASELATERSKNLVRDHVAQEAIDKGYRLPPGALDPDSKLAAVQEMIAGKKLTKTLQSKNQRITDMLARRALGLGEKEPLAPETLSRLREAAQVDYDVVRDVPSINWDEEFIGQIQKQLKRPQTATKLKSDKEIAQRAQSIIDKNAWTGEEFVEEVRRLRELERSHTEAARRAAGDKPRIEHEEIARAAGGFRSALEKLAERNLKLQGADPDVIRRFSNARKRIAISHDVEHSLTGDGHVDARKIAQLFEKRGGRLDAELGKIGRTARQFGNVLAPHERSVMDFFPSRLELGGMGASWLLAHPGVAAISAAPSAMRLALGSKLGQKMLVRPPSYKPGLSYTLPEALQLDRTLIGPSAVLGTEGLEDEAIAP